LIYQISSPTLGKVVISEQENIPGFKRLTITGQITIDDITTLDNYILNNKIYEVVLNSPGGDLDAALKMGDILYNIPDGSGVDEPYLPNVRAEYCASACVFILASSRSRLVTDRDRIVVHAPYTLDVDKDFDSVKKTLGSLKIRAIKQFERSGVSDSLWNLMSSVGSQDGRQLTIDELRRTGLADSDPVWLDYVKSKDAKRKGMTKQEYLKYLRWIKEEDAPWLGMWCFARLSNGAGLWVKGVSKKKALMVLSDSHYIERTVVEVFDPPHQCKSEKPPEIIQ